MLVRPAIALVFVLALSVFAADISIGCGQPYVYGVVSQKYTRTENQDEWLLQIGTETWEVPESFWYRAHIGDTVKFNGKDWQVVKTVYGTVPSDETPNVPPSIANPPNQPTTTH